ncbi:MlaD family protein [uncultured Alistipes sp.]|uniref:MlaD family protein n=1 Tax=uncultured Alistipes sp. TaxID=538949 RepID=UPI0025E6EDA7|nr:MlaD family protein [uncultured Alistipes sp.]
MKREIKIGLFALAMLAAAWAGIRFLKGFDLFSRNIEYYARYDRIDGVQAASPIMMRGVKIGSVTGIDFDPGRSEGVVLHLTVAKRYRIPSDSEAKIVSDGLLGGKAVELVYGRSERTLVAGDTLLSGRDRDLMDMAGSELDFFKQKFALLTADLSRTLGNLNALMETNARSIAGTMANLDRMTGDMADVMRAERENLKRAAEGLATFSETLGANAGRVDSIVGDLHTLTSSLAEQRVAERLAATVDELNDVLEKLDGDEGTMGRLMNDPALYESLTRTSDNLGALLADFKQYPARYVHLSLFGRNPEKMKERADRKAAREAARASRDSLKRAQE